MDNLQLSELRTAIDNRISSAKVGGFWTSDQKDEWLNFAVVKICSWTRWKFLELAKTVVGGSVADQENYDYPEDFTTDSIYYMEVDGDEYIKKSWSDYQTYKANGSTDKIFSSYNGYYFIYPIIDEAGLVIDIWGIKKPTKMTADEETSGIPGEFDESIVKLAFAKCLKKAKRINEAIIEENEVLAPANPRIDNSGGTLAQLVARQEDDEPKGFIGKAKSTRFMM